MIVLTIDDLHNLGYCNKGPRQIFADHGKSWSHFLENGIAIDEINHIDDAMVQLAIQYARDRAAKENS
jgi:hypothetical protein